MYVKKRNGSQQPMSFDKIKIRIMRLAFPQHKDVSFPNEKLNDNIKSDSFEEYYLAYMNMPEEIKRFFDEHFQKLNGVNPDILAQKVIDRLYDGINTRELDEEAARLAAGLETQNINYGILAKRILVSNLHKNTSNSFIDVITQLYCDGIIADYMYFIAKKYGDIINKQIKYERDYRYNYFGFKTLEKLYLLRNKNQETVERIQHMWMRVALAIFKQDIISTNHTYEEGNLLKQYANVIEHDKFVKDEERSTHNMEIRKRITWIEIDNINFDDLDKALEEKYGNYEPNFENAFKLYNFMSQGFCTHATPTLFNSGTRSESHISCYLKASTDSIEGMYQDNTEIAKLFKSAGGVGYHLHDIRGRDALIKSSNRPGEGIVPFIKMLNDTSRHVKQGGRRNGSLALYLETWHVDIMDFLELKKPQGDENARARDLFYGLWIPDMFMEAVKYNDWWYLMSPDECPGLSDTHNEKFRELYTSYIKQGRYRKKIRAQEIWDLINDMRIETGTPYMVSKDASNRKSNQQNLGTIKSSNLCVAPDTMILTDKGYQEIKKLENQQVTVWNGFEWSKTMVKKTGTQQKLMKISFSDGTILKCTPYHKFHVLRSKSSWTRYIPTGFGKEEEVIISAKELINGDKLISWKLPLILGGRQYDNINLDDVPFDGNFQSKLMWWEAFKLTHHKWICLPKTEKNMEKLRRIKLMLETINITTHVNVSSYKTCMLLPETSLILRTKCDIKVKSIKAVSELSDTYCFNEPINHTGIFNGVLTGNCSEIILYSDPDQTADCVLASVALSNMIINDSQFDFNKLGEIVTHLVKGLNRIIDCNKYVTDKTRKSNNLHRPIGIGVQGLADCFMQLRIPFDSARAKELNRKIFETMYYYALKASMELAKIHGPYSSFQGSPSSQGQLQFDLWNKDINQYGLMGFNWEQLKENISNHGLRNSTLLALMPTASTSIILGNNECMEPITANLYKRKNLAGEFVVLNKYLVRDLEKYNLWTPEIKNMILAMNGSIQQIPEIPNNFKKLYKTVWEIKQKVIVDLALDRGPYICQSQSMNLYFENPTKQLLNNSSFYAWERGLKTLCYYTRTRPATGAVKFTLDQKTVDKASKLNETPKSNVVCTDDVCTMCSA